MQSVMPFSTRYSDKRCEWQIFYSKWSHTELAATLEMQAAWKAATFGKKLWSIAATEQLQFMHKHAKCNQDAILNKLVIQAMRMTDSPQ